MKFKHYLSLVLSCVIFGAIDYGVAFFVLLSTQDTLPYSIGVCITTTLIAIIEGIVFHLIIPEISTTIYDNYKKSVLTIVLCHTVAFLVAIGRDIRAIDWYGILFWFMIFVPLALYRCCGLIIKVHKDKKNDELSRLIELKNQLTTGSITQKEYDAKKKELLGL